MSEPTGQIVPGSPFGDKLTELAREAKVIVEIGTWKGGGSTECLRRGFNHCAQWLITIESNPELHIEAQQRLRDWRIWCIWGTIVRPDEFPPYYHPLEDRSEQYKMDIGACGFSPYCLPIIPHGIDLLLLDGGEWSSHVEFTKLKNRSRIIALDDTHPDKSVKSYAARDVMLDNNWDVLADEPDDRNGWFIARRP